MQARSNNRELMLVYGNRDCRGCRSFHNLLRDPYISAILAKHLVILELNYDDDSDAGSEEAQALIRDTGGTVYGVPYYAIVSKTGRRKADSTFYQNGAGWSLGYPSNAERKKRFVQVISKACQLSHSDEQRFAGLVQELPAVLD